jgi:cell surface protein SprA
LTRLKSFFLFAISFLSLMGMVWATGPDALPLFLEELPFIALPDSDSTAVQLPYPFDDRWSDPYNTPTPQSPMYLGNPSNINTEVIYNPEERQYDIYERLGDGFFRNPSYMTFEEFKEAEFAKSTKGYWKQKANADNIAQRKGYAPRLYVGGEAFNRIFGGNTIDIRPQGSASLAFGLNISRYDNPTLPERQRKITTFDFREQIQMNVIGNIGEKLKITTNYNTQASFDFENQMKLEYTGYEDEIIQKIEAGNVNLPLNSQLIQGSQSLFGLKTQLKFGRLMVTSLLSQQRGQASNIEVKGGATTTKFDIPCDQYEVNRHYFLGGYFKNQYDVALSDLPFINSLVAITRLEVWVTNRNNSTDNTRTILATMDLGENAFYNQSGVIVNTPPYNVPYPSDSSNNLYAYLNANTDLRDVNTVQNTIGGISAFVPSRDYEVVQNARRLQPTEYSFNPRLGYISLNQALNGNEVLAVAYEYTIGGKVYRVGDLTNTGVEPPKVLFLKLVKARVNNTQLPTWDLMMKNVYALGGFQIDKKDFRLDVLYYVDTIGNRLNYIPTTPSQPNVYAKPLNRLFNLDKLNVNNDPRPDGEFDFIEGVTINSASGRIIFPVREPFGPYLRSKFTDSLSAQPYAYDALYDSTRIFAIQQAEKNKFSLKGSYVSKFGSDIPLNAINIPQGSVKVTAGGAPLVENVDYTVDYNLGRVKIINQSILNAGTAINISLESNTLFSIQSKTLFGSRFDYTINKDLVLGGTLLRLNERPITQKVNIGDEPIANTIWGVDGTWRTESRWLTKMIDKLPGITTKEPSNITVSGEFANLVPGNNRAIGKNGTAYIDDFEGSQSTIDLRNVGSWMLASAPVSLRPEANSTTLDYGKNRALFNWYIIDPLFYRNVQGVTPPNIDDDEISNHLVRQVPEKEIFPNRDAPQGQTVVLPVFNVSFYPEERGPYNFDVQPVSGISAGIAQSGKLNNPASRWGGIMRRIETTDFDVANVEFIQFWMMDPFNSNTQNVSQTGGDLYFNLGNVSEDVLKDGKLEYENGLPVDGDTALASPTIWGYTPRTQPPIIYAFDNNPDARQFQDVGFDGLRNTFEPSFFQDYLAQMNSAVLPSVYQEALADPSSDNYHYYRGSDYDSQNKGILDRYKKFSNPDGNSPTDQQSPEAYPTAATTLPDVSDVNKDFNQEASEQYYQYRVSLRPGEMEVGQNFIVDKVTRTVNLPNGTNDQITWYQFKVPIREVAGTNPNITRIGDIQGFNTISFIRMFMAGFDEPMTLRFARLELLRGEWRKYSYDLRSTGDVIGTDPNNSTFDIAVVNIEENGKRTPINYVIPPGINQEVNIGSTVLQRLNEQSLAMKVCNLEDGDARAAFKNIDLDLRLYNTIKMFIHAEASGDEDALKNGDLNVFVRLGNDFNENYYEYEVPLSVTGWASTSPDAIWPNANSIDLNLESLVDMKLRRNKAVDNSGGSINITGVYTEKESGTNRNFSIRGNPSLSSVRCIMIGVRNPKRDPLAGGPDDGQAKCGEVWVNELRLTDFSKQGGWAANARVNAKLADIGNVTVAGQHKSAGFGPLEQKVSERPVNSETTFNVTSSVYLGKFLPQSANVDIPMYVNYGAVIRNPQYDPLDQDVLFSKSLDNADSKSERREIKRRSQDYTQTKAINFTNVKKNRSGSSAKQKVYDIENFNLSYGYDEVFHRDINIEYDVMKTHRGSLGYNYNTTPKYITPLGKAKAFQGKYLKPLKEVNLNLLPTSLNFRYDVSRLYGEKLFRNNTGFNDIIRDTFFNKNFEMRRLYDFKYDLTRSIKIDFTANNYSVVDEPEGKIDTDEDRDSIKSNIWGKNYLLGRNKTYTHQGNVSYQVPLNKFPLTDWVTMNVRYGFNYGWTAGQFLRSPVNGEFTTDPRTGNTIQNSNTKQLNGNFTLTTLYNKVPFLKKLNSPKPKAPPKTKSEVKKEPEVKKPGDLKAAQDTTKGKKVKKPAEIPDAVRFFGKMIMGVKTVGFTYSENMGTSLPGYVNYSDVLGQDLDANSPGWGFVTGSQRDIRSQAVLGRWITTDTALNNPLSRTYSSNFSGRSSIEPITGLKIELSATRQFSRNNSEYFRWNGSDFSSQGITETGNFSISVIAWNTAFVKDDPTTYNSTTFDAFNANRKLLSERLAALNPNSIGFAPADTFGVVYNDGYSGTQQEVLALAFISAYTGQAPGKVGLSAFPAIPLPNWRITYDGLGKLPLFKKIFTSVNLTHGYRATYSVNSFQRNASYVDAPTPITRDIAGNFVPRRELTQISMSEQFGPLLGVDITWKNSMQTRAEFRRDRNVSLTYAGVQITEVKGNEIVLGFGYRIPKFKLPFAIGGRKTIASNSLNLTADFSARRNITIIRRLQEGVNQPTAGLNVYSIKGAADYAVNERLNMRLFYEQTINTPVISTSFPTSNILTGIEVRFSLSQ